MDIIKIEICGIINKNESKAWLEFNEPCNSWDLVFIQNINDDNKIAITIDLEDFLMMKDYVTNQNPELTIDKSLINNLKIIARKLLKENISIDDILEKGTIFYDCDNVNNSYIQIHNDAFKIDIELQKKERELYQISWLFKCKLQFSNKTEKEFRCHLYPSKTIISKNQYLLNIIDQYNKLKIEQKKDLELQTKAKIRKVK